MGKNFKRIKRQVALNTVFSALMIGVAISLIGISAIMLYSKLTGGEFNNVYYALGGAAAVVVSAIFFVIFMPSDKKLAKAIDEKYSLDEKTRTAMAFHNSDNSFVRLQREDADEVLGQQPRKSFRLKQIVAAALIFAVSVGCMAGAVIIPAKADGGEAPIDEFDKQWILTVIDELILTVDKSFMYDSLKVSAKDELTSLRSFVEESVLLSEMKARAVITVVNINRQLSTVNSSVVIGETFYTSNSVVIAELGAAMISLSGSGSKKALGNFGEYLDGISADDVGNVADELNAHLGMTGVSTNDPIYLLLKTLVGHMRAASETGDTSALSDSIKDSASILSNEVLVQNVNKVTIGVITTRLCNLFGITEEDLTVEAPDIQIEVPKADNESDDSGDDEIEEPNENIGSGGLGTGETIYGSDDMVFDPNTGTYRPYGEILNDYYAKINELIVDGRIDEDIKDAVENYFDILYTGSGNNGK